MNIGLTKQMRYYYRNSEKINNDTCINRIMKRCNVDYSVAKKVNDINKKSKQTSNENEKKKLITIKNKLL